VSQISEVAGALEHMDQSLGYIRTGIAAGGDILESVVEGLSLIWDSGDNTAMAPAQQVMAAQQKMGEAQLSLSLAQTEILQAAVILRQIMGE
jgi:hypothetical protein